MSTILGITIFLLIINLGMFELFYQFQTQYDDSYYS